MTEEEARKKWCPMVRITLETEHWEAMNNREQPLTADGSRTKCIASDCMMWIAIDNECRPSAPGSVEAIVSEPAGYCGLAGRGE